MLCEALHHNLLWRQIVRGQKGSFSMHHSFALSLWQKIINFKDHLRISEYENICMKSLLAYKKILSTTYHDCSLFWSVTFFNLFSKLVLRCLPEFSDANGFCCCFDKNNFSLKISKGHLINWQTQKFLY